MHWVPRNHLEGLVSPRPKSSKSKSRGLGRESSRCEGHEGDGSDGRAHEDGPKVSVTRSRKNFGEHVRGILVALEVLDVNEVSSDHLA